MLMGVVHLHEVFCVGDVHLLLECLSSRVSTFGRVHLGERVSLDFIYYKLLKKRNKAFEGLTCSCFPR